MRPSRSQRSASRTQPFNEKELNQEQLADAAGVRQALISELENGKNDVRLDTLDRVARGLGKPMADLFDETKR